MDIPTAATENKILRSQGFPSRFGSEEFIFENSHSFRKRARGKTRFFYIYSRWHSSYELPRLMTLCKFKHYFVTRFPFCTVVVINMQISPGGKWKAGNETPLLIFPLLLPAGNSEIPKFDTAPLCLTGHKEGHICEGKLSLPFLKFHTFMFLFFFAESEHASPYGSGGARISSSFLATLATTTLFFFATTRVH